MRKVIIILGLFCMLFAQEVDLATVTAKLDEGTKLYQKDQLEEALGPFQEAADGFEKMLQGVLSPEDEAYAKYFLATAHYYVARIQNDASLFESTSQEFSQSASAFRGLDIMGEEYVRSQYMKALCSFRLYQLATTERSKIRALEPAIGDFSNFVQDDDVLKNAEDFQELIDNAYYFLGYCKYQIAFLKSFDMGQLSNAQKYYDEAITAFQQAQKAQDERLVLSANLMEANCHYMLARLYFRPSEDEWNTYKLSSTDRLAVAEEELRASLEIVNNMISAAGTQKDLQMFGRITKLVNKETMGSIGFKDELNDAMSEMTELKDNPTWGRDILNRVAYGSLLNFLIYGGPNRAATVGFGRVVDTDPEALYWTGMVHFIQGEYADANAKFPAFMSRMAADRSTRSRELQADAKFRQAECMFWLGVKGNTAMLSQADAIYKALENPKGEYYEYLTKDVRDIVAIRSFLIGIETSLGKERDVSVFDAAMALAGLQLPRDAEKYLSAGKYFLQKAIETAGEERKVALNFAIHAFNKVINASVSGDLKNRARFMKGVALVKLATVQEKDKQSATINDAKSVLQGCTSPYADEADYVIGIGYFNINDYSNALPILQQLKAKGHIRAAYHYAIIQIEKNQCTNAARSLGAILSTIKDRTDPWYQKADLELSNLSCRNEAKGVSSLARYSEPPMTYENLVDEEAERERKKSEALFIWQRSSKFIDVPDIDELLPDRPPETNVNLEIAIQPPGGEESIIIDGKEGLAKLVENSVYKVTLNRGTHKIKVKKKGFYLLESEIKVSKSERINLSLAKAVRYTPAGELTSHKKSMTVASSDENIFIALADKKAIIQVNKDGKTQKEYSYKDLGIGAVSGLALDEDNLIIVDPARNQIVSLDLTGQSVEPEPEPVDTSQDTTGTKKPVAPQKPTKKYNTSIIAYEGETYGSAPLSRPAGIAVKSGVYYIADAGNSRVVIFDGSSFRKEIGIDKLVHPVDVAVKDNTLYIADIGNGSIVRYTTAGEFIDEITLQNQTQPAGVYVSPEGFVFVSDFVKNTIVKYTADMELLSPAGENILAPRAITQIGTGPEAVVYVANASGLTILKGGWDNTYMPE